VENITIKDHSKKPVKPAKNRIDFQDLLFAAGFALLEIGIGRISVSGALICAGLICLSPFVAKTAAMFRRAIRGND